MWTRGNNTCSTIVSFLYSAVNSLMMLPIILKIHEPDLMNLKQPILVIREAWTWYAFAGPTCEIHCGLQWFIVLASITDNNRYNLLRYKLEAIIWFLSIRIKFNPYRYKDAVYICVPSSIMEGLPTHFRNKTCDAGNKWSCVMLIE